MIFFVYIAVPLGYMAMDIVLCLSMQIINSILMGDYGFEHGFIFCADVENYYYNHDDLH